MKTQLSISNIDKVLEGSVNEFQDENENESEKEHTTVFRFYLPGCSELREFRHSRIILPRRNKYDIAMENSGKYIEESLNLNVEKLGEDSLRQCALADMSAKLKSLDSIFYAELFVEAVQAVRKTTDDGEIKYSLEDIKIVKTVGMVNHGFLVKGYMFDVSAAQVEPTRVAPAKIACMNSGLEQPIVIGRQSDSLYSELVQIHSEYTLAKKLLAAGANVILSSTHFDNMMQKEFMEAHAIAVCVSKKDLEEFSKATGAVISTPAVLEREEYVFDHSLLTLADEVVLEHAADSRNVLILKGTQPSPMAIVFLQNGLKTARESMERAFRGGLNLVKRALE